MNRLIVVGECAPNCGACCMSPDGARCEHLLEDKRCALWPDYQRRAIRMVYPDGSLAYPSVCTGPWQDRLDQGLPITPPACCTQQIISIKELDARMKYGLGQSAASDIDDLAPSGLPNKKIVG